MALTSKEKLVVVKAFAPANPLPLDAREIFESLADARSYAATSAVAYAGQTIKVVENGAVTAYNLAPSDVEGENYKLQFVGGGGSGIQSVGTSATPGNISVVTVDGDTTSTQDVPVVGAFVDVAVTGDTEEKSAKIEFTYKDASNADQKKEIYASGVRKVEAGSVADKIKVTTADTTGAVTATELLIGVGSVKNPTYDAEAGKLTLPVLQSDGSTQNVEVSWAKDKVVTSGVYNEETQEIELTITDGTVVKIPAAELVDIYTGGTTNTATTAVSSDNKITVAVKISTVEGNLVKSDENGLYVSEADFVATKQLITDGTAGAKAYADEKVAAEATARGTAIGSALTEAKEYTDTEKASAIATAQTYTNEKVAAEVTARETAVNAAIDTAKEYTNTEVAAAEAAAKEYADEKLAAQGEDQTEAINSALAEAKEYADTEIGKAATAANTYTDTKVGAETAAREAAVGALETSVKEYADTQAGAAETNAKAYADEKVGAEITAREAADAALKTEVKEYADTQAGAAETNAKSYADEKVGAETTAREAADEALKTEVKGYTDTQVQNALAEAKAYTDEKVGAEVTARDAAIDEAIAGEVTARDTAINTAVSGETAAREAADAALKTEMTGYTDTEIGKAKTAANTYADEKVSAEATARGTAIEEAVTDANAYTDAEVSGALTAAKAYTDQVAGNVGVEWIDFGA